MAITTQDLGEDASQTPRKIRANFIVKNERADEPFEQPLRTHHDNFVLLSELGSGSFGIVYKATLENPLRLSSMPRFVALKAPVPPAPDFPSLEIAEIEYQALSRVPSHENVASMLASFRAYGTSCTVTELLEGGTLRDAIAHHGPFEERTALQITLQLAKALRHIHSHGVAHRDIKTDNIMFVEPFATGANNHAKIIDFGLAHLYTPGNPRSRICTDYCGQDEFMVPQAMRYNEYDAAKADVYSLGVVLAEMLCAENPFEQEYEDDNTMSRMMLLRKCRPISFHKPQWSAVGGFTKVLLRNMLRSTEFGRPTADELVIHLQSLLR